MGFIINVAELMLRQFLPRPRSRCTLHDDMVETLDQLEIIHVTATDGDYYDGTNIKVLH